MISKNQIKLITSLHHKKFRQSQKLFIAEGEKVINELLKANFVLHSIYVTDNIFSGLPKNLIFEVEPSDLKKISALTTPNNCLAVFEMKPMLTQSLSGLIVALDDIRDPGNFGTIIRLCDWFGIKQLICSDQTVDLYNPKVVQSTMGSLARVNVNYGDLSDIINQTNLPVFGTFMDGDNIYQTNLPNEGIIVMGNEANGISSVIENRVTQKIAIPRFGDLQVTESLNVATATGIILSEFRRNS